MPVGMTGFLGLGKEITWGTPVAAVRYAPLLSESLELSIEQIGHDAVIGGGISQQLSPIAGRRTIAGEIVAQSRPAFLGDLLRMIFGPPTTTTLTAGQSFSHEFKPRNAPFSDEVWGNPYTIEVFKGVGTQSHQFAGVVADTLELRWGAREQVLVVSVGVIGKLAPVFITKTTPSIESTLPFTWNQCTITLPEPTTYKQFSDLTLRLSWGLRAETLIDGTTVIGVVQPDQLFAVELSGTVYPFTTAEYNEFVSQSERNSIMTFNSGVNIGTSSDKYLLRLRFPRLRYSVYRYGLSGVGLITADITARSYYDSAAAASIVVTLQNAVSAY